MKRLCLLLPLLATGCGQGKHHPHDEASHTLNVQGEDPNMGILLSQGLNSVSYHPLGFCVDLGPLKTQSGNSTGAISDFRMVELNTESELKSQLNLSASASFSYLTGGAKGAMGFSDAIKKNSMSRYMMVHTRVANQLELASSFTYTDSAQKMLKLADKKEFLRQCGDEFAYGRRTGGEFYAIFEFDVSSEQEDKEFSAAITASGAAWKISSQINSALQSFNKFALTRTYMYRVGTSDDFPQDGTLEDFARKFPSLIKLDKSPVTLEILTKSYDGVDPKDLKPNYELLSRQQYVMHQLAQFRDNATELLNSVHYIKSNTSDFDTFDPATLKEQDFVDYINKVNDAAVACAGDVWESCKIIDTPLPTIAIPQRRLRTLLAQPILEDFAGYQFTLPRTITNTAKSDDTPDGPLRHYWINPKAIPDVGAGDGLMWVELNPCGSAAELADHMQKTQEHDGYAVERNLVSGGRLHVQSISLNYGQSVMTLVFDKNKDNKCLTVTMEVQGNLPWSQMPEHRTVMQQLVRSSFLNN